MPGRALLAGRTILVQAEQGLGDTLQFIRYVPLLERRGARVIVEVQPPLVPLLRGSGFHVIAHGTELPDFDEHVLLMSLPRIFETELNTIPADIPYLAADPQCTQSWRQRLAPLREFRVGIHWQGNPAYVQDAWRSIPLMEFAPLAAVQGVSLISLQREVGLEQLPAACDRFTIHELGDDVDASRGAFMDTAAVMQNLDLVDHVRHGYRSPGGCAGPSGLGRPGCSVSDCAGRSTETTVPGIPACDFFVS